MIRIRGFFAAGGLLLALAMVLAVACGGGSGGKSKTATPAATGTGSPPATTTGTPNAANTPGATAQPSGGTPQALATSTYPPRVTPPPAFDAREAERARELLRELKSDMRDLYSERRSLRREIPLRNNQPTPTLVLPVSAAWFDDCCASKLASFQRELDAVERSEQRVATIYSDTGHTQGKAMMDQFVAQLNQIRTVLEAVASAATPQESLDELDAVSPILDAMGNTVSAALSCCSAASAATATGG